jgi:tetratricopeptide (TPR) repeat protein
MKADRESLKITRDLYRKHRMTFKLHLRDALNNIAVLYMKLKKYDESERAFQEALKIIRDLAAANPEAFKYVLVSSQLSNVG